LDTVGQDRHIITSRAFRCADDSDAIVWAKQLADGHDIELWSGDRFVIPLDKPSRTDQARQVIEEYAKDQREIIKKLRKMRN
jgi:hypothetical protein